MCELEQSKVEKCILIVAVGLLFFCLLGAPYLITLIQTNFLTSRPDAIVSVASSVYNLATVCSVVPVLLLGSIGVRLYRGHFILREHIKFVIITAATVVLSVVIPCVAMMNHYEVTSAGVSHYNAFGSKTETISWDEVTKAKTSIQVLYGATEMSVAGNWKMFYLIELPSGKSLDLYNDGFAKDKLNAVAQVDGIVREKDIPSERNAEDLDKFPYKTEAEKQVIHSLFDE